MVRIASRMPVPSASRKRHGNSANAAENWKRTRRRTNWALTLAIGFTVAYFLALGHYDAHVNRLHQAFRRRRVVMNEAIRDTGLSVAGRGAFGGSSFWMAAPEDLDTEDLALVLRAQGVLIEPGRQFFAPGREARNCYRLAYSSIAPGKIPEGIARIAEAIAGRTG